MALKPYMKTARRCGHEYGPETGPGRVDLCDACKDKSNRIRVGLFVTFADGEIGQVRSEGPLPRTWWVTSRLGYLQFTDLGIIGLSPRYFAGSPDHES